MPPDSRPLIAHVIYRLDVGGLENGLVNLINHLPADGFRHAILCLKGHDPAFARRIQRADVLLIDLDKKEGKDLWVYGRLWRHFRRLKPAIVHTRNLTSLVAVVPALLAGVPYRIHGEHGRDMSDLDGSNKKHRWFRRLLLPLTHRVIALSQDLEHYLTQGIGVPPGKVSQFYNGVDTDLFHPRADGEPSPFPFFSSTEKIFTLGTVGRMQAVKNQLILAQAFITLVETAPKELAGSLRLVMIGEGELRAPCQTLLDRAGLTDRVWLPGARHDIPPSAPSGPVCAAFPGRRHFQYSSGGHGFGDPGHCHRGGRKPRTRDSRHRWITHPVQRCPRPGSRTARLPAGSPHTDSAKESGAPHRAGSVQHENHGQSLQNNLYNRQ
ncbi:MAG: glycosyltransferase [Ferrovum myxofaciens]